MKQTSIRILFQSMCLLMLAAVSSLKASSGNDTWTGAAGDNNWSDGVNWTGANTPPVAGDTLVFGQQGAGSLTLNNNTTIATSYQGLTFNATAPAFVLNGNQITDAGAIFDNSLSLETINLPIAIGASQTFAVTSGGLLTINNVVSGAGSLVEAGSGLLTLTGKAAGANTFSGGTTINAGTLELDYSQGGSTPAGGILASGALTLGGGALTINGASATADSQTFTGTTLNAGQNVITAVNGTGGGTATVTLNALTVNPGASVVFNGPASTSGGVATATGTITTTTAGQGQATTSVDGILATGAGNNAYATVGLYDWATTDSGATTAGTTVIGGSSISGFYLVLPNNNSEGSDNDDVASQQTLTFSSGSTARLSSSQTPYSIRFNTGIAPYLDVKGGSYCTAGGLLVTPNLGVINVGVCSLDLANTTCQIVQNNTMGVLVIGIDSTSTSIWQAFPGNRSTGATGEADTSDYVVKSGAGTMFLNPIAGTGIVINYTNSSGVYTVSGSGRVNVGTYDSVDVANTTSAAFDLNGGVTAINNANQLGNPTTQGTTNGAMGTINLNGGTLMGVMGSFGLTNAASGGANRPVFLADNGGGLAAQTTNTLTVPGVISAASGSGPLTIGIPASNANGNNVGLVPGTGAVGSYVTKNPAYYATGTVLLTGTNTYTGNTIVSSGTLQLGPAGSISNSASIIVASGATYDVSQVTGGYILFTNQELQGSGTINGSVTMSSGSSIDGGTGSTYGTNTFNNNLTLATGATADFDLGTSATGSNDEIVVNGNLTLNGNAIHIKAPSTSSLLDVLNYTLFSSSSPITVNGNLSLVWDVPSVNYAQYQLAVQGNKIVLQYVAGNGPIVTSPSASPNPAWPLANVLISATVIPNPINHNPISSITADVSQIAGTGLPGSGATVVPLVLSATANVYTNSVTVGLSVPLGSVTNIIAAVDNATPTPNATLVTNAVTIASGLPLVTALTANPNPAYPNAIVLISATVPPRSYPVSSVTADVSGIEGTGPQGTSIVPLVLSGTPYVYTNSVPVGVSVSIGSTVTNYIVATDTQSGKGYATNTESIVVGSPLILSPAASPNPVSHGQPITISATITARSYPVNPALLTVDVSGIAGTAPGTTILPLVLSATPNVYTNGYTVLSTITNGAQTLTLYATDTANETNTATITLNVINPTDLWVGDNVNNLWDNADAANRIWNANGEPIVFANGDAAVFDDTGSASPAVALNSALSPASVTFKNSAKSYTISGTGGITGAATVVNSSGNNTLTTVNTYTGTTTINGGSLTIGGAGQLGAGVYAAAITDNGILNYTSSATQTNTGAILGTGALSISAGILTLPAANAYSGGTTNNGGVIVMQNSSSLGTGNVIMNGGTVMFSTNGFAGYSLANSFFFTNTSTIDMNHSTNSEGLVGAWSGNGTVIISNLDWSVPGINNNTLTIGGNSSSATMNAFSGKLVVAPMNSDGLYPIGSLRFNNGTTAYNFGSSNASFNLGTNVNDAITLTARDNGTNSLGELIGGPLSVLLGSRSTPGTTIWSVGGLNTTTTYAGTISNFSTTNISALTKVGTGTLILTGTNNAGGGGANGPTGPILVSAGTLQIGDGNPDGSLSGGTVTISSGATLSFDRPDSYSTINSIVNSGILAVFGGGTNTYSSGTYTGNGSINVTNGYFVMASPVTTIGPVYVGSGATFDVSQDGSFVSVQSLAGSGTNNIIGGSLTAFTVTGGIFPGGVSPAGSNTVGTLTIDGGLVEGGNVNNQFVLSKPGGTNDLLIVNGNLDVSSGIQNITLNEFGGGVVTPGTYPLILYTGTLTGDATHFSVAAFGFQATVTNITTTTPPEIAVIVTPALRPNYNLTWVGNGVNNDWDTLTPNEWVNGGTNYVFQAGDSALFTDSGSANPPVNLQAPMYPTSLVVSNTVKNYIFTGVGNIAGTTGLTKTNGGRLTLLTVNGYTGPTVIGGGVLELQTGAVSGLASPIGASSSNPTNLIFYGSTLMYSGMDASNGMDHSMTFVNGMTVNVTNATTAFTEYGLVTGSGGLTKVGNGTFVLQNVVTNTYMGGTVISNGVLVLGDNIANWDGAGGSGVGPITNSVTFMGTNGTLQLYGWLGNSNYLTAFNNFYNPLVVPAGQIGTLQLPGRGNPATGAGAGLNSSLTGGGTINLVANYVRYPLSGNWSAFSGLINVTGAGFPNANANTIGAITANVDEFRINNSFGYTNAAIYLAGDPNGVFNSPQSTLLMCQTVGSGATIDIGELGGDLYTVIGTGTGSAGTTTWRVGWKSTTNTFYGTIEDDAQAGVGVTSITKVGTGEWILAGINTYSGSTSISNGVLALILNPLTANDASIASSANIFINTNAVLDVTGLHTPVLTLNSGQSIGGSGTLNGSLSANSGVSLNPGSASATGALTIIGGLTELGGVNNNFQLSTVGNSDVIRVHGTLDVSSGPQNINLSGLNGGTITAGIYPLFTYTSGFNGPIGNLTVNFGAYAYSGILTNITTTTPPEIAVIVGAPSRSSTNLVWLGDGVANNWDTIGKDWVAGATSYSFQSGDSVTFNDRGAGNTNVTLQNTLYPTSLVVSNSTRESYTFTGNGGITGSLGLLKTNNGTLTILATNTYTGPTVIGGGTISVPYLPNGGLASPIGAAANSSANLLFYDGGTLAYTGPTAATDRGATLNGTGGIFDVINGTTLTLNGVFTGSGALSLTDAGGLILTAANTYTGGTTVSNNTLTLQNAAAAGTGPITLTSNATLVVRTAGTVQYNNPINVTGNATISVPNTGAALLPEMNGPFTGNGTVVLNMDTANNTLAQTFGIGVNGMANFNGTFKVADNTVQGYVRFYPNTGVNAGINGSSGCLFDLGTNTAPPGVRFFDRTGNSIDLLGALAGGPNTLVQGAGSATAIATTFVIGGKNINATYYGSIQDGAVTPVTAGNMVSVTKVGTGTQTLAGVNTYSGPTVVSNGVLQITGSIGVGTNFVTIQGGTLSGSGTINATVTNQVGGTLEPGAGTNVAGTVLTLNSNLTLLAGSTTIMQVVHGGPADQITSAATITYGGILMVATNAGDATPYQVGDTFTLFNLGGGTGSYNAGSGFATIQPPPGPGLGWSGANLTLNGSIQVVAASPVVANFSGTPTAGVPPLAVTFTNQSSGAGYWVWNFGDGTTLSTGGNTNVSHGYANAGSYTVSLTAYGVGGASGLTNVAYVVVGSAAPVAGFSGGPTNVFVTQTVTLKDASTGSITNWVWSFGDGTGVTNTTSANVSHAYAAAGSYTVSLTVAGAGGSNTNTQANYVVVKPKAAIGGVALSGGKFVFRGTNGVAGAQYRVLTTTNVAMPLAGWTPVWTNVFAADGSFSYTNTPGVNPAGFFLLVSP